MADELRRIDQSIGDDLPVDSGGSAISVARRRLETARAALFDVERSIRLPEVDRDDVEALENAHEQVLLAQDRLDKRLAGGKAKQRLDEARAQEQQILNRLGFVTYTEFVMGTSIVNVDPEHERQLDAARGELAAAEDAVAELEAGVDAELARASMVARRRELVSAAITLLGRDPGLDLEWALRQHRVRVKDSTDRSGRLLAALENAGMALGGENVPPSLLIDMAKIWLDELAETSTRRTALEHELHDVESRLARASQAALVQADTPNEQEAEQAANRRVARRQAQLEEARAAVDAAIQRVERQEQIDRDVAHRKADLEAATRAEEAVAAALAKAEDEATGAAEAEHAAAGEQARAEGDVAAIVDAERQAHDALQRVSTRLEAAATAPDTSALEQAIAEAEASVEQAAGAVDDAHAELARIDDELSRAAGDEPAAVGSHAEPANVDELEWYLLSRVAAQRSVSYAGSVPLVLDDALEGVHGADLAHLLSRLERMSAAVQVIVLSDNDEIAQWAESVGPDRAATLSPSPA